MTTNTPMTELECYIQSKKTTIQEKIHESILKIEQHFNIKLDYDVTDVGNDIIIKGVEEHSFTIFKWFQSKLKPDHLLNLNCKGFPFTLPQSSKSIFFITFNDDFSIKKAQFRTAFINNGDVVWLKLYFNNLLMLEHIEKTYIPRLGGKNIVVIKSSDMLCPFDDEVVLFKLAHNKNEEVKELLPEYYIPSAYDFNTEEFADRLKVYSMLTL